MLCFLTLLVLGINSKILPSKNLPSKSLKFNEKKEQVNNIMLKALTGVLAKKAFKGVLSSKGKEKLARSEAHERNLVDVKTKVPAKNHRTNHHQTKDFWAKAEKQFKRGTHR